MRLEEVEEEVVVVEGELAPPQGGENVAPWTEDTPPGSYSSRLLPRLQRKEELQIPL